MADDPQSVLLLQFAKAPCPGQVKTRMMPHLSADEACDLHRQLVLWTCGQLLQSGMGRVELCVQGDRSDRLFTQCLTLGAARATRQSGVDLGQRMYRALRCGLARHSKVLLVGSDCPGIDAAYLAQALARLDEVPMVLGPAADGGYVLVGATQAHVQAFVDIPWGSAAVYAKTVEALEQANIAWLDLPVLVDIDRPEDLPVWHALRP